MILPLKHTERLLKLTVTLHHFRESRHSGLMPLPRTAADNQPLIRAEDTFIGRESGELYLQCFTVNYIYGGGNAVTLGCWFDPGASQHAADAAWVLFCGVGEHWIQITECHVGLSVPAFDH